jgi:hypothetical protein
MQEIENFDGILCTSKTVATIVWPDAANDD